MVVMVHQTVHIQTSNKKNKVQKRQLKREIGRVICKALMLVNQMHGSFNDFEDVLTFAKDFFFRNEHDHPTLKHCLRNWRETEKLLNEFDYKGPK